MNTVKWLQKAKLCLDYFRFWPLHEQMHLNWGPPKLINGASQGQHVVEAFSIYHMAPRIVKWTLKWLQTAQWLHRVLTSGGENHHRSRNRKSYVCELFWCLLAGGQTPSYSRSNVYGTHMPRPKQRGDLVWKAYISLLEDETNGRIQGKAGRLERKGSSTVFL